MASHDKETHRKIAAEVPIEMYDEFRALAKADDRTVSSMMRLLVRQYIDSRTHQVKRRVGG